MRIKKLPTYIAIGVALVIALFFAKPPKIGTVSTQEYTSEDGYLVFATTFLGSNQCPDGLANEIHLQHSETDAGVFSVERDDCKAPNPLQEGLARVEFKSSPQKNCEYIAQAWFNGEQKKLSRVTYNFHGGGHGCDKDFSKAFLILDD